MRFDVSLGLREIRFVIVPVKEVIIGETGKMDLFCFFIEEMFEFIYADPFFCGYEYRVVAESSHPGVLEFLQRDVLARRRCQVIGIFRLIREGVNLVEYLDSQTLGCYDSKRQGDS